MVKCESEVDLTGGAPGGLAGLSLDSAGFRLDAVEAALLAGPDHDPMETLTSTSASSYSIYKQRIDSMFDETRSLISGYGYSTATPASAAATTVTGVTGLALPLAPPPPPPPLPTRLEGAARAERRSRKDANVVQARIEKMFAEMSSGGGRGGGPGAGAGQRFSVDYLGSVPLVDKVTTLQGLQGPLKDLYFGYRRDRARRGSHGGVDKAEQASVQPSAQPAPWQPGFLEISGSGLRVHHGDTQQKAQQKAPQKSQGQSTSLGQGQGQLEQLNPFPRIAVWAAVQFICRQKDTPPGGTKAMECAFLPLIADPSQGGVDKDALFRDLSGAEERVIRSMRSILRPAADTDPDRDADGHDAPMFAVVMRGAGASRQLECHGFVCASSEDAIVMAANLYQALMASMRTSAPAPAEAETEAAAGAATPGTDRPSGAANTGSGERLLAGRIARMHHENGIGRLSIAGSVCGDSANGHATDSANSAVSAAASLSLSAESSCSNTGRTDRAPEDAATLAAQQQAKQLAKQAAMKVNQQRSSPPQLPKVPPPVPKRPPRKKKTSGSSTDGEDLIVLEDTGDVPRSNKTNVSSLRGSYTPRGHAGGGECVSGGGGGPGSGASRQAGSRRSSLIPSSDVGSGAPTSGSGPGGDILTKVAIPRSHSFLNANGPLTRYGRRPPNHARNAPGGLLGADLAAGNGSGAGGINGLGRAGGGGGSPLGFNELFTEFRQQEGLDSLDDILGAIIDAEGMSFNDLKPIYKEFLLKLALTLTKDELYHRSKSIMRRQRKKQLLGAGLGGGRGRRRGIAYTAVYIKRAVRRSINKLRPSKRTGLGKLLFSGGSSPNSGAAKPGGKSASGGGVPKKKSKKKSKQVPVAASSISSYPSSNFRMSRRPSISVSQALDAACNVNVNVSINNNNRASNKARLPRRRSSRRTSNRHHHQPSLPPPMPPPLTTSTSEDSDFFTMIRCDSSRGGGGRTLGTLGTLGTQGTRSGKGGGMNRSSSGYVSCSDCSYDSESCTCLSAERCYCSLSKYRPPPDALPRALPMQALQALSLQPCACACDTDSCQGSDKCYCTQRPLHAGGGAGGGGVAGGGPGACARRSGRAQGQPHHARCTQRQRQRRGSSTPAVPIPAASAVPPPANIFEQLRQQGFAASDSSLSRAESPMTAWRKNESRMSGRGQRSGGAGGGGGGGAGAGDRRKQRASSSAGSMRSSRSLEFLQGPLLGHLQASAQSHLLPQHQYPMAGKNGKPPKSSGKQPKTSSKQASPSKIILDGFGSARSRCPSRMDMYRSSTRSCSYIAAPVLEPPAMVLGLGLGRQTRPRLGSGHGGHGHHSSRPGSRAGSRPTSRPTSRAESRADSWVCEDEDADEPVDDDEALGMEEDVHLLLGDASSTRRSRQTRQARQARERKVLVVSARDPEGRVIYMGASASASASASARMRADSGHGQGVKTGQFFPRASLSHSSSSRRQSRANLPRHAALVSKKSDPYQSSASMAARAASEALSVKKSAEIAALFTGVKVSQTTDIVATARSTDVTDSRDSSTTAGDGEELLYSSLDGHSRGHGQRPSGAGPRQGMYLSHTVSHGSSLENSLGYLP